MNALDERLRALGVDPNLKATISYAEWKPWDKNGPEDFTGFYVGYKDVEKMIGNKRSEFNVFLFESVAPAPSSGEIGYAVTSGFQLEMLKRIEPGTRIAILFLGDERNDHNGKTHKIAWYFVDPDDRKVRVSKRALPPMDSPRTNALPSHSETTEVPF